MLITVIVLAIYALVIIFDYLPYAKSWTPGDKAVYWVTLLIGFGVLFLVSLDVKLPNPTDGITALVALIFPNLG